MKKIETTPQFLRDLKKATKQHKDIEKFQKVVTQLQLGIALTPSYRPHKLQGEWKKFWECHIEPDWLLIYKTTETTVILVRLGSHNELF